MATGPFRGISAPTGVGLGLRWEFLEEIVDGPTLALPFLEVSPENYMRRGGYFPAQLQKIRERYPLFTHGLTLSIGGESAPRADYLSELAGEIARLRAPFHSDHLCVSGLPGRSTHELLPLRFTRSAARRIAERVARVENELGVPLALENISYYAHPGRHELTELEFIEEILEHSKAGLLLDVNNVYVNALNHSAGSHEAAYAFLERVPYDRVVEIHVAGHTRQPDGAVIDTHGAPVIPAVHELLQYAVTQSGPIAVLLERDNDVPPLSELMAEVEQLRAVYERAIAASRAPRRGS
ncbi:MAG TPA: DUF692 domain-containing protein [Polyangiaceae bacterium]|nr:DUF692 domain-containing protein [Polyangiaceae bacterium]